MIEVTRLSLFFTLVYCHAQQIASLDLFVHTYHQQLADPTAECDTCVSDSCFPNVRYYVEDECLRTANTASNKFSLASNDTVCRNAYFDDVCSGDNNDCYESWTPEECQNGYDEMTVLPDWCIQADAPQGDYVVPMVLVTIYPSDMFCQTDEQAIDYLIPSDPSFCQAEGVTISDATVIGGSIAFCDGNALKLQYFADTSCTETPQGIQPSVELTDVCTQQSELGGAFTKANCTASIYCKNLYNSGSGVEVSPVDTSAGASTTSPSTASEGTTNTTSLPEAGAATSSPTVRETATSSSGSTSLALFAHIYYLELADPTVECDSCDNSDACFSYLRYYIESDCLGSANGGSSVYSVNNSSVCRDVYSDNTCSGTKTSCYESWMPYMCQEGYDEMKSFPDWCVTGASSDGYVVPMISVSTFASQVFCNEGVQAVEYLFPDDPTFCQPYGVELNNNLTKGGRITYCDGNTMKIEYFADEACTEQPEGIQPSSDTSDVCTEQGDGMFAKASCSFPLAFCKALPDPFDTTTAPPVAAPTGEAPTSGGEAPTSGGEAPTSGGEAPTSGGAAPTSGGEAPTAPAPTSGSSVQSPVQTPTIGTESGGTASPTPSDGGFTCSNIMSMLPPAVMLSAMMIF